MKQKLVSVHGGHSGEFCCHAKNSLIDIVKEYIKKGFEWVVISEHMPPISDGFLYPIEIKMGYTAKSLQERFKEYIAVCKSLKERYKNQIEILVGFETEAYSGSFKYAEELIRKEKPDCIVGSVHHVNDVDIDSNEQTYIEAAKKSGSLDKLYLDYFDLQFKMMQRLKPSVIGHFDLVRIYDPEYKERIKNPTIFDRVERNLDYILSNDMVLDYNLKGFLKNAKEPYISEPILDKAIELGVKISPGDDSHGTESVGLNMEKGLQILSSKGVNKNWPKPNTITN
jgi:histidinol-phosphatase (PHP family)